jgi:hypothetical protein
MAALALVANYIFIVAPNIELGSSVLFVTGFLFGIEMAASSVLIIAIVFGIFNPWGVSLIIIEIWVAQVIGWLFIVAAGHIMGGRGRRAAAETFSAVEFGIVGILVTLFYDLVTNLGLAWSTGLPFLLALVAGLPFMLVHLVSNGIIFGLVITRLDTAIRKNLGSVLWRTEENKQESAKSKKTVVLEQV